MVQFFWLPFVVVSKFLVPSVLLAFLWYCFEPALIGHCRIQTSMWSVSLSFLWFNRSAASSLIFRCPVFFVCFPYTVLNIFFLRYLLVSCVSYRCIYTVSIWFEGYTTTESENPMIVFQFVRMKFTLPVVFLDFHCYFFSLLVVVGTLCKGKRKEVKVIDRNMFPGLILQREGTESEKKECISVFYIVQYIKEERRKKIFGGTRNAGRPPAAAGIIIVVWRRLVEGQPATWGHWSCVVESSSWGVFY